MCILGKLCAVIAVYNEAVVIHRTVKSLFEAGFTKDELFFVDDCSTDDTYAILQSLPVNSIRVDENGGKAMAQRFALKHFDLYAKSEYVIFLDGDTIVDPNFRAVLLARAAKEPAVGLFVGRVKSSQESHIYSAHRAVEYTFGQDVTKEGQSNFGLIFVSPGCASMYRTDVLSKLSIDNDTLAEDMDLTMQAQRLKSKVRFVSNAIVITQDPCTLRDYTKQISRWYRGFWQIVLKHGVFSFRKKQFIDIYMMYLCFELFTDVIAMVIFACIFHSILGHNLLVATGLWLLLRFLVNLYVSIRTRRLDVLYKFPQIVGLQMVNMYVHMRSFVEIVVLRKTILTWNKVARY